MSDRNGIDLLIRYFAWGTFLGAVVFLGALVFGLLRVIPVGGSVVMGFGGLLIAAASAREVVRGRRIRARRLQAQAALAPHDTLN